MLSLVSRIFVALIACSAVLGLDACGGRALSSMIPQSSQVDNSSAPLQPASVLMAQSSATSSYAATVISANPLAYYMLNDAGTTMADSGARRLNGVYGPSVKRRGPPFTVGAASASATYPGRAGGTNIAANTSVVTANPAFAVAQHALTVEAWISPTSRNQTGQLVPIVSYGREAQGQAWVLQINAQSMLNFWMKTTGGRAGSYNVKANTTTLQGGQIYHVVASYDGATAKVYVNGNLEGSTAASGAINYSGITPQFGLAVGGALGSTLPIFNGGISDVAVYASALSAAQIQQHFVNGHIAATLSEVPAQSDAFVDTIGVVTHMSNSRSLYATSWPTFQSMLKQLGVRHVGDALVGGVPWYTQHLASLAGMGIHATLVTNLTQSSATIKSLVPQYAGSIEGIEGPNEPDLTGGPNWVTATRTFQRMLWSTIKGNPSTANLTVIGSPLVGQADDLALGNLSAYMDRGNMHDYFNAFNPGTAGWGSTSQYGTYGSISMNRNVAAIVSSTKPVMASETGYGDGPADPGHIDDRTLSRYIPRIYLEHFLDGIPRTTVYEFYDEPGGLGFQDYGLVRLDNTPKPSYTVLKNLIGLLADPGSSFQPARLSYVIGGNVNQLHHVLLQKRNGTFELVLWLEVPSIDPHTRADITVPPQTVTVHLSNGVRSGTQSTFDDRGNMITTNAPLSAGTFSIPIDDRVSVLTMK